MKVVYKDIEGFPGYKIGNDGSILSNKRGKGYINSFKNANGYMNAVLYNNGKRSTISLHKLIAQAFLPNPNNYDCINHKDENPLNNYVHVNPDGSINHEKSNLEWCSRSYNRTYGTCEEKRKKTMSATLAVAQYDLEGHLLNVFSNCREAARYLNLDQRASFSISRCALGFTKISHGYVWKKVKNQSVREDKNNKNFYELMKDLYNDLTPIIGIYKASMEKEYASLKAKNDAWRLGHNNEDNENYYLKMWALGALFNSLDIINTLYIESET